MWGMQEKRGRRSEEYSYSRFNWFYRQKDIKSDRGLSA
jgi:hypothetical protein